MRSPPFLSCVYVSYYTRYLLSAQDTGLSTLPTKVTLRKAYNRNLCLLSIQIPKLFRTFVQRYVSLHFGVHPLTLICPL